MTEARNLDAIHLTLTNVQLWLSSLQAVCECTSQMADTCHSMESIKFSCIPMQDT
jgi:hypothetical protein